MPDIITERAYDARFRTFFKMMLAGPSGSGKTLWVYQFLKNHKALMTTAPANIVLYYNLWQPIYDKMKEENLISEFIKGYPSVKGIEQTKPTMKHDARHNNRTCL